MGSIIGLLNGYIRITGGIIAVPSIILMGYRPKKAAAYSLAIVFLTCITSLFNYNLAGYHVDIDTIAQVLLG